MARRYVLGSLVLLWSLTSYKLISLHSRQHIPVNNADDAEHHDEEHDVQSVASSPQKVPSQSVLDGASSLPRVVALYFPQFHPDPINDRLWGANFTDWDSLRNAPKLNRMGYAIPRPTELGYYDLSDDTSGVRRKQGELAREYGIDAFAYHHYWFYDEDHPGPNLHRPLELMLLDGEPDVPFCLHWAAMKWVNTWQSSGGETSERQQPKDGVLQLQYFPDPNEVEGRSRIADHYKWLRRFFHHKNYIKINGQPLFMLYQKKPGAVPVLEEFRRLAIEDGFTGMYFTVGLTRPHADLQSFFPFRGIQRFKGFDTYNATVAYPNPADWSNRSLTVPEWCENENAKDGSISRRRSTEIPGIIVSFDNTPRRSFEDARILSNKGSKEVVATFRESLKAAMHYESCCLYRGGAQNDDRFILVNAWNEWAEGMTLEPSDVYGRQFLETVRAVKKEIITDRCTSRVSQQSSALEGKGKDLDPPSAFGAPYHYKPAFVEAHIMEKLIDWGWNQANRKVSGCSIWTTKEVTANNGLYAALNSFRAELKTYHQAIEEYRPLGSEFNIIKALRASQPNEPHKICDSLRIHPEGLDHFFPSKQLSFAPRVGYIEPLTTPMRHPDFCFDTSDRKALMDMRYMVHDFEHMCRNLQPTTRLVLIDLGASLSYHDGEQEVDADEPPILYLLRLYQKFGFRFDHIYGYEVTFKAPNEVYEKLLPVEWMPAYHWINIGVSAEKGHTRNPLDSILRSYEEEDFVVLKIDIDSSDVELPLVHQLLEDDSLLRRVDQLYFEHHVKFKEMAPIWRSAMKGSLKDTFDLFYQFREKGVAAHFWP